MTKKQRAEQIIERLSEEYPLADCTLDYDEAWKLLVSVRLAAQCTDARVNIVVQDLYAKYPTVAALAEAKPEDIEAIVRPCGLGKSKAKDICACMKVLHEQYQDNVPDDFDALIEQVTKAALYDTGITAEYGDQLLTLSTCDSYTNNGRFVVVAKEITNDV